jgi:sulfite reductase alpha subunit-like flavoprotein
MIGPGTGLAPFRSFTQERISSGGKGRNVLYFGCRNRSRDFLYREELEKYNADKQIELHTAFSREQKQKVYVQDRLRESATEIWSLLESGAHVYVCGDAQYMAGQVHDELLKIISSTGGVADAKAYMDNLEHQRRYQRDIWF